MTLLRPKTTIRTTLRLVATFLAGVAVLLAVTSAGGTAEAATKAKKPHRSAPANVANYFRYSQGWRPRIDDASVEVARRRIVILQGSATAQRDELRAAGGNTRLLLYKDPMETIGASHAMPAGHLSTAVDYHDASLHHTNWFLHDAKGQRITRHYTPTEVDYLMDVGNRSYQKQVVTNLISSARAGRWDGIFLDDVLPTTRWWLASHDPTEVVKYPTDRAYSKAYGSFVKYVGTRLRAAGLMVIANTCCDQTYHLRSPWSRYLNGTLDEGFVNPASDPTAPLSADVPTDWNRWTDYLHEVVQAERTHKILLAETTGGAHDRARARYALGTVLLAANGETMFEYHTSDTSSVWTPDQQTSLSLGKPKGSYVRMGSGVYKRNFANGIVVVNPRPPGSTPIKVSLKGFYSGSGLTHVWRVSTRPTSALVMLKDPG